VARAEGGGEGGGGADAATGAEAEATTPELAGASPGRSAAEAAGSVALGDAKASWLPDFDRLSVTTPAATRVVTSAAIAQGRHLEESAGAGLSSAAVNRREYWPLRDTSREERSAASTPGSGGDGVRCMGP